MAPLRGSSTCIIIPLVVVAANEKRRQGTRYQPPNIMRRRSWIYLERSFILQADYRFVLQIATFAGVL